jgi:hypothetical protein
MILAAAAPGVDWGDLISYIPTLITGAGVAGLWVLAFLRKWVVSGASHEETCQERDQWRDLYLKEQEAHSRTRESLLAANQRGDAAVESGRMVVSIMEAIRTQAGQHPNEIHSVEAGKESGP